MTKPFEMRPDVQKAIKAVNVGKVGSTAEIVVPEYLAYYGEEVKRWQHTKSIIRKTEGGFNVVVNPDAQASKVYSVPNIRGLRKVFQSPEFLAKSIGKRAAKKERELVKVGKLMNDLAEITRGQRVAIEIFDTLAQIDLVVVARGENRFHIGMKGLTTESIVGDLVEANLDELKDTRLTLAAEYGKSKPVLNLTSDFTSLYPRLVAGVYGIDQQKVERGMISIEQVKQAALERRRVLFRE